MRGHRGGLLLQSTLGHGSSFIVLVPALFASAGRLERDADTQPEFEDMPVPAGARSGRALDIDVEPTVRETVCTYLRDLGF